MCIRSFFFPATAINFISIMGLFLSEFDFLFVFVKHLFLFLCNHAYISEIDLVLSVCVCVCVEGAGGFPHSSVEKESTCNVGDLGLIPGEGKGYPLQYSGLEISVVAKSWK